MRPIIAGFFLVQAVLLGSMSPGAGMAGQQLLQTCEFLLRESKIAPDGRVSVSKDAAPCWFYISAIQDFAVITDASSKRPRVGFCLPPESTLMQLIRIFVDYAQRNPAQLHESGAWLSAAALAQAFPCR
jgi:hypothetical protein